MEITKSIAGRWIAEDESSDAEFIILFQDSIPSVTGRCISDGEFMEILDLEIGRESLKFGAVVPSSGHQSRHVLRFPSAFTCDHELTYSEPWEKALTALSAAETPSQSSFSGLTLSTERLLLRPLRITDAEALFKIFSDPEVMRYWSTPPWTSITPAEEMIQKDLRAMPLGEHLRLGMETAGTGELIGICSLFKFDAQSKHAMIGYGMARSHWGQGYMAEALSAMLDYAFGPLDFRRIEADIDPRNTASARILEKLGFAHEGRLRERWMVGDEISDSDLYGLLRRDWGQMRKPR